MSRATNNPVKPATSSKVTSKPAPTNWKDRLDQQDWEELKQTFEVFDEDGSGTIDAAEINKVLEELGVDKRNPLVIGIINRLKEANRSIKFEEFVEIVAGSVGEVKTKDGIRRVFALLDKNEDGHLDFEEFKQGLKLIQERMNDDDILEMMHSTFINRKTSSNESFTFDEFYSVVSFHNQSK
jgi:Ca2+-binding EF-hand superfamily protein